MQLLSSVIADIISAINEAGEDEEIIPQSILFRGEKVLGKLPESLRPTYRAIKILERDMAGIAEQKNLATKENILSGYKNFTPARLDTIAEAYQKEKMKNILEETLAAEIGRVFPEASFGKIVIKEGWNMVVFSPL